MYPKKVVKSLAGLTAAYPNFKPADPDQLIEVWSRKLADFEERILDAAVDQIIEHSKFFPTLNEFLEAAKELRDQASGSDRQKYVQFADTSAQLRFEQLVLEEEAVDGEYDPAKWEALAVKMEAAKIEWAAEACRAKSLRVAMVMAEVLA
jgi:hypothetical protein